ncbi:MAG: class 3 adenylate cyclase/tetratricopeptide (TPR) repeat protein [Gammaproteobacteria bacterium]|jgi:class 3 adenylate cyclase/tetratricopeptide (TPR) repeat protein
MHCENCRHTNSPNDKFCSQCGTPQIARCSGCNADLKLAAKFCSDCGTAVSKAESPAALDLRATPSPSRTVADYTPKHLAEKILQSRSALEGERKQVTVLFADVKGSMDLAARVGAEDWHELLDRFFAILTEGVHRYEGTINQYTGDGVMALFGAPISHEDHAQRACYAAVQMRDELRRLSVELRMEKGIDLGVRMGINSGEVVVGRIGDDLRMDYTAQGHTVGVAQRLEQLAESGHAYISEHTARLVEGYFQLSDLGTSKISGSDVPVGVFDLDTTTNVRTRLQVSRSRGLTQFVGRKDEMDALNAALARARNGHGQVVGVVGEPGLGKSRLCFEFVERCRAQSIPIYEAHCPSHGQQIPFIPIRELFRNYFDISDQDTGTQARQKIAGMLLLLDPEMHSGLPVLFDFLGVGDPDHPVGSIEADVRQRQMFDLLHKISRVQNERGLASLILIDDLHWIDSWSDEFVAQMVEATQASHTLLLVNFRPEYQANWTSKPYYQQLPLVPLGADDVQQMVTSLLGADALVQVLIEKIRDWTTGNPLYAEEVINTLIETGQLQGKLGSYRLSTDVAALEVPASVQAIIAARIDRLTERDKTLLQAASVLGKEFSRPIVEKVASLPAGEFTPTIEALKNADFIYEIALYPTVEYSFKHPLVHEVAYDSQLRDRRAQVHAAAASAIETLEFERLDEYASMLAYHWENANVYDDALRWHQRAALVLNLSDPRAALHHWTKVRSLVDMVDNKGHALTAGAQACGEMMHLQWRLGESEAVAHELFRDGSLLADLAGNIPAKAVLTASYAALRGISGGYANDYVRYGEEAAILAAQTDDIELKLCMRSWHVWGLAFRGDNDAVVLAANEILDVIPTDPEIGIAYFPGTLRWSVYSQRGLGLAMQGQRAAAFSDFETCIRVAGGRAESIGYSAPILSVLANYFGDFARALNLARISLEITGSDPAILGATVAMASCFINEGKLEEAAIWGQRAHSLLAESTSYSPIHPVVHAVLADIELALGNPQEASRLAIQTIEFCQPRELLWFPGPWLSRAQAYTELNDRDGAHASLLEAQALIERNSARLLQPFLHERQAHFAAVFNDVWREDQELATTLSLFEAMGAIDQISRLQQKLAKTLA